MPGQKGIRLAKKGGDPCKLEMILRFLMIRAGWVFVNEKSPEAVAGNLRLIEGINKFIGAIKRR
jgi:hypothetical protein